MSCHQEIHCPACGSHRIIRMSKTARGIQRYRYQNEAYSRKSFMLGYVYNTCKPSAKEQIVDFSIN
jgi:transposase-like protein